MNESSYHSCSYWMPVQPWSWFDHGSQRDLFSPSNPFLPSFRLTAIAEDRLRIRKPTIDQMNSIVSTVMSVIFDRYQYLPSPSTFLIKKLRWYTHCFRLKTKSLQGSVDNNSAISWLYDIISLCSQSRNQNFPTNLCFLDSILKQIWTMILLGWLQVWFQLRDVIF